MSVRQQVQQRIMADLPTTVGTLVAAVTDEIPAYRALAPEQLDEVGAISAWATSRILDLGVRGTALDAVHLTRFRASAPPGPWTDAPFPSGCAPTGSPRSSKAARTSVAVPLSANLHTAQVGRHGPTG